MNQLQEEKVELFISFNNLRNRAINNVSHPYVVMLGYKDATWIEYGRTDKIDINLNPELARSITIEYVFEIQQYLIFEVYHFVDAMHQRWIGRVQTILSEIVGSRGQKLSLPITDDQRENGGTIIIKADHVNHCSDLVTMLLKGKEINKTRTLKGPNPFLRFYRQINDDPSPVLVHETEPIINSKNPEWKSIICQAQKLCNGDYKMPIKIELWDSRSSGNHILQGQTSVTLDQLKIRPTELLLQNMHDKAKLVGKLEVKFNWIVPIVDFLLGGLQLNLLIAIDFTGSNKDIKDITSLHYQDPKGTSSLYEQAIISVGDILINYDYDKKVPVYGFGCKPRLNTINTNQTLHCFNLNDNPNDPEVNGLQGIVQVYRDTVGRLDFCGPTYLHPVIQEAMKQAQDIKDKKGKNYLILLILTDGQTDDLQQTIDDVIDSSLLPLSIIIIGIGNGDFKNMNILDNDDLSMKHSQGKTSQRDLVQFVQFNKSNGNAALLSKEVLQELPDQISQYMKLTNQPPQTAQGIQQQQPQNQVIQQIQINLQIHHVH